MPKPRGLWNNGNTCYFNATLQNLHRTIVFRKNLDHISALWRQKNQALVVNESISSESSFFAKLLCNVKQLLHNAGLRKCFFFFLASLALYKAGSSGVLISSARWIFVYPQLFLRSNAQKLLSNATNSSFYVDDGTNCAVITFEKYLELLQICPKRYQSVASHSLFPPWLAVLLVSSAACIFCCRKQKLRNLFREVLNRFSECGRKLSSCVRCWWSRDEKGVLFCSGALSYCAGHLMALSQPIYAGLLERNPETLCVLLVMASSSCYVFCHFRATEVLSDLFQNFRQQPDEAISVALARFFRDIDSDSGQGCHNPRSVLEAVCRRSRRFLGYRQQDSHELLRHLLDGIREDERNLKMETKTLTLVDKVFGGHFRTVYTCETCASPHCLHEAFLDISLPITLHEDTLKEISETDSNERNSVEFWLKVFTRSENLGKQYLCSVCNVSSTGDNYFLTNGKKQTLICDPPAILCIHVKRFRKGETVDDFVKANDHVEFSEYLDLKPYLTNDSQRLGENRGSVMYALFGVVVHSGSLEGGHYTAYIKSEAGGGQGVTSDNAEEFLQHEGFDWDGLPMGGIDRLRTESLYIPQNSSSLSQTKEWYYCSDSIVERVDAGDVFRQAAYLLFYERLC